jgi:transcriptional regulator GlxA family with amidase domain
MLTNVAVVVFDSVAPFEFGVLCEAFGLDRTEHGVPLLDFAVCSPGGEAVRMRMGLTLQVGHDLDRVREADLVAVPAMSFDAPVPDAVIEVLRDAQARGARLLSVCSGAFTLAEAGLLDGLEATTHWMYAEEMARRYPRVSVVPEVLYVDAGQIVTSAGSAAGLDAALHLWRQEHGAAVASMVARRMVVPPHRDGGQAQYVARPVAVPDSETLGPLLDWVVGHLAEPLDVAGLAERAGMSARTFARRFREETGATPHAWIVGQRVRRAEELLETSDWPVERIATEVGFDAAALRLHFARARGVSPARYRRTFAG